MHLAATEDSAGNVVIYKNGVQVGSGTTAVPNIVSRTLSFIGRSNWTVDGYFDGSIDELSIYNRALRHDQIKAIYDAGSAGKIKP